jgi:release factor glutamine methyltransferase
VKRTDQQQQGTVGDALGEATAQLEQAGLPEPRREAEYLLAQLLNIDRGGLIARKHDDLSLASRTVFMAWVQRRLHREPAQHITGVQEFYGLTFKVDRRALVPRPETEGLVDAVLELDLPRRARVADLGTGSACISVALAVNRRDLEIYAMDSSADALALAGENVRSHGLEDRIVFLHADFRDTPERWKERMHVVVSNPPYVAGDDLPALEPEVRRFDPLQALVPGPTGLEAYPALAATAFDILRPEGVLVVELGQGQAERVSEMVQTAGFRVLNIHLDLRQIPRVLVAEKP